MLHFVASRVLVSPERAELAIHNCWLAALQKPQRVDRESAFRSWLARILITEALTILHEDKNMPMVIATCFKPPQVRPVAVKFQNIGRN